MQRNVYFQAAVVNSVMSPNYPLTRGRAKRVPSPVLLLAGLFAFTLLLVAAGAPQLIGGVSLAGGGQVPASPTPRPVQSQLTDMVVIQWGGKTLLLTLDGKSRSVSYHALTADSPGRLSPGDFAPFLSSPKWRIPTALACRNGKLYVADRGARAVFEADLDTRDVKEILGSPHVSAPVSVAVSEEGDIAVGDDDFDDVVLVEPGSQPKRLGGRLDDPDRLSFIGRDLVVLDTEVGAVSLAVKGSSPTRTEEMETVNGLLRSAGSGGADPNIPRDLSNPSRWRGIVDFNVYRGVYYVAGRGRVVAFTPNSSYKSFPVFQKEETSAEPACIAVSHDYLLIGEAQGGVIRKLPRPVPASVSFGVDASKGSREVFEGQHLALASLYEYLDGRGLLDRRSVTAKRDYATPLELLREEGALVNWPARDAQGQKANAAEKRLAVLLAKFNAWAADCKNCPVERPISKGESVIIPGVQIEKIVTASDVSLGPKTVKEHLMERVAPEHLSQVSANYLLALNRNRLQSFEAEISRINLIPSSNPTTALAPGTLIRFEGGREIPIGHLRQCSTTIAENVTVKEMLPSETVSSDPLQVALPRLSSSAEPDKAFSAKLKTLKQILISFDKIVEESIGRADLNAALEAGTGNESCSRLLSTPDAYVVTSVRRAAAAKYRLIGKDGQGKQISEGELERLNLRGEVDKSKEWSFTVNEPLYLAYALARVNPQVESLAWESVRLASTVKPESSFDVFAEKQRVMKLPATVWRLSVFVHAPDLRGGGTVLSAVSNAPGVDLLSEESQESGASSRAAILFPVAQEPPGVPTQADVERIRDYCKKLLEDASGTPADPAAETVCVRENRKRLLEAIKYFPPTKELTAKISEIVIGVGESDHSVHKDHPAFAGDSGSAWYEKDGLTLVPRTRPHGSDAQPPRIVRSFSKELDHGDHVAGLIAARGGLAPGLVTGVGLYLIDNRTAATLGKSVDEALALVPSIGIFNFSFDIPGHALDKNQEELLKNMSNRWKSALFVVAAGNDGADIGTMSERLPISWADRIPNIIGVAASHGDDLIADMLPGPGSVLPLKGSNYGEKYVHIAAPGRDLYSVASENRYAAATGTSQAAPLVTAAAAALSAQNINAPTNIKARLIYTSDWVTQIEKRVWGGLLNYRRAIWQPRENLLRLMDAPATVSAFKFKECEIKVGDGGEAFDARGEPIARPPSIRLSDILRIETVAGNKRRVVYLERHGEVRKIRILRNASLGGDVICQKMRAWDATRSEFEQDSPCARNFDAAEIFEYVAATPNFVISF